MHETAPGNRSSEVLLALRTGGYFLGGAGSPRLRGLVGCWEDRGTCREVKGEGPGQELALGLSQASY